jgi:hypothetical protein
MSARPAYRCVCCHIETAEGRFTRHTTASERGWRQGFTRPHWYCFTCLPFGSGRGESPQETTHGERERAQ